MYVVSALFALIMIPIALLVSLGVPLIIGVVVYRDANRRVDCSPWLWALVAALVPSFIGVVIYLICRRDYPLKDVVAGDDNQTYYQRNYDSQAVNSDAKFPTWAKALIIIFAVVILLFIISIGCAFMYYVTGRSAILY